MNFIFYGKQKKNDMQDYLVFAVLNLITLYALSFTNSSSVHSSVNDLNLDHWPQINPDVFFTSLSAGEDILHIISSHARVSN